MDLTEALSDDPLKSRTRIILALLSRDGAVCWFCGEPLKRHATIEHHLPESKAPLLAGSIWNMALAHRRCNSLAADARFSDKLVLRDYLRGLKGLKGEKQSLSQSQAKAFKLFPSLRRRHDANKRTRRRNKRYERKVSKKGDFTVPLESFCKSHSCRVCGVVFRTLIMLTSEESLCDTCVSLYYSEGYDEDRDLGGLLSSLSAFSESGVEKIEEQVSSRRG